MFILSIVLISHLITVCTTVSLEELACRRRPDLCSKTSQPTDTSSSGQTSKKFLSDGPRYRPTDFSSWKEYGSGVNDGTGMGAGVGPNYGPGLGEVEIVTGVGVQHPFGSIGVRRDFHVGWGGTGRIGGTPFGFGNGIGGNGYSSSMPAWQRLRPFSNDDTWPMPLSWATPNWG
uniref:Uncharacterized protein n=1 Tax=Acrobeloides nanus TaxID=290746 RepID=A0A914E4X0_9BILA